MSEQPPDQAATQPGQQARRGLPLHWQILIGLAAGAALGLVANALAALDQDPGGLRDRLDWWVLSVTDPLGRVFLRLIFMVVIPLVFSALALGAAEIGDLRRLGGLGLRTLAFTAVLSTAAVVLGMALVNAIRPGRMLPAEQQAAIQAQYARGADSAVAEAKRARPFREVLLDVIPENPFQEMVGALDGSSKGNGMLAVMFFALVCGVAMASAPERCRTLIACTEGVNAATMAVVGFAMHLAPYGVACLVFGITARLGLALVAPLAGFVLTVLVGLALQLVVVYSLVLWWFGSVPPRVFFRRISEAMLMAFGSSSSNATLPTALRVAQEELHLPRDVSNFVLTIGATGNQNGTALYEGVVVLFLAQVFNVEMTLTKQLAVMVMSVMAGIGTAGIPGGSLPPIVVLLIWAGIPPEAIGIILGIDRILDMCRTVVNVAGDLVIATCVSRVPARNHPVDKAG